MECNWSELPPRALRIIFSYCSDQDLDEISYTCQSWYKQIELMYSDENGGVIEEEQCIDLVAEEEEEEEKGDTEPDHANNDSVATNGEAATDPEQTANQSNDAELMESDIIEIDDDEEGDNDNVPENNCEAELKVDKVEEAPPKEKPKIKWTFNNLPAREWKDDEYRNLCKKGYTFKTNGRNAKNKKERNNLRRLAVSYRKQASQLARKKKLAALARLNKISTPKEDPSKVVEKEPFVEKKVVSVDEPAMIDLTKIKQEKEDFVNSVWIKLLPKALKHIESFLTLEDALSLRLVCKEWNESLQQELEPDECDIELFDHPTIDLLSDTEETNIDDLLVAVIFRCSSESVVSDVDWKGLDKEISIWLAKHKFRRPPKYEKLKEKYKDHVILKCADQTSKKTLTEIIDSLNKKWRVTSFEVVSKAEIPRKGPYLSLTQINKILSKSRKVLRIHKGDNIKKLGYEAFCRVAKAWEDIDRYATFSEKSTLYKALGVKDNPRKHPRKPVKKLCLTPDQLAICSRLYPATKRVIKLMDQLNRKIHLSDSEYDTLKFGTEWLLHYKEKTLIDEQKEIEAVERDKKRPKTSKVTKKSTISADKEQKTSSSEKPSEDKKISDGKESASKTSSIKKDDKPPLTQQSDVKKSLKTPTKTDANAKDTSSTVKQVKSVTGKDSKTTTTKTVTNGKENESEQMVVDENVSLKTYINKKDKTSASKIPEQNKKNPSATKKTSTNRIPVQNRKKPLTTEKTSTNRIPVQNRKKPLTTEKTPTNRIPVQNRKNPLTPKKTSANKLNRIPSRNARKPLNGRVTLQKIVNRSAPLKRKIIGTTSRVEPTSHRRVISSKNSARRSDEIRKMILAENPPYRGDLRLSRTEDQQRLERKQISTIREDRRAASAGRRPFFDEDIEISHRHMENQAPNSAQHRKERNLTDILEDYSKKTASKRPRNSSLSPVRKIRALNARDTDMRSSKINRTLEQQGNDVWIRGTNGNKQNTQTNRHTQGGHTSFEATSKPIELGSANGPKGLNFGQNSYLKVGTYNKPNNPRNNDFPVSNIGNSSNLNRQGFSNSNQNNSQDYGTNSRSFSTRSQEFDRSFTTRSHEFDRSFDAPQNSSNTNFDNRGNQRFAPAINSLLDFNVSLNPKSPDFNRGFPAQSNLDFSARSFDNNRTFDSRTGSDFPQNDNFNKFDASREFKQSQSFKHTNLDNNRFFDNPREVTSLLDSQSFRDPAIPNFDNRSTSRDFDRSNNLEFDRGLQNSLYDRRGEGSQRLSQAEFDSIRSMSFQNRPSSSTNFDSSRNDQQLPSLFQPLRMDSDNRNGRNDGRNTDDLFNSDYSSRMLGNADRNSRRPQDNINFNTFSNASRLNDTQPRRYR